MRRPTVSVDPKGGRTVAEPEALTQLLGHFAIALALGGLVGAERERHVQLGDETPLGLRTFALLGLTGAALAHLGAVSENPTFEVGLAGVALLVFGRRALRGDRATSGLTTEVAALLTYGLGGTLLWEGREVAVALGVALTATLALKEPLHRAIHSVGQADVYAVLKLLFATFIVLPVLPRRAVDPWGALNPYALWWLVILIAGISMVGYVGVRWLGPRRGTAAAGLFGGLVSSTAVTLALARRSREQAGTGTVLGVAILIAWSTMAVRVLVEVAVVERSLLVPLLLPMSAFLVPSVAAAALIWRRLPEGAGDDPVVFDNPFRLGSALRIGLLFAVVILGVRLAQLYLPASGVYLVAAIAGATDVDAITLSLARETTGGLDPSIATRAIVLASASNTVVKLGLALFLGDSRLRRVCLAAAVAMLAGAALALRVLA